MKVFIVAFLNVFLISNLQGQENILYEYIKVGLENNLALKQEHLGVEKSLEALIQARGMFMPDISFNANYNLATGGRTIDFPAGDLLNSIHGTLNELTDSNQFPTDLQNVNEPLLPNDFHDTFLQFRQPLFNSDIFYQYKANKELVSVQEAKRNAFRQELIKEIKVGYYKYLQALELRQVYDTTEILLRELLRINQRLFENDKVTKDAVYSARFELDQLESQQAEAFKRVSTARSYFNFLLNRDLDHSIRVDENIMLGQNIVQDLDDLRQKALLRREELKQTERAIDANQYILKLNQGSRIPQLSMGARTGFQGFGYAFDGDQDYALMQFGLEFPIFRGFQNKSKIQESRIELERWQSRHTELKKKVQLQVSEAYRDLNAARKTYQARQSAVTSAGNSFEIIRRKYRENMVLLVEFLDARTKYTNAQLELAVAKYDVLVKNAVLERTISFH